MKKKSLLQKIAVVIFVLIATTTVSTYAQGPGDPGGGPAGDPPVGAGAPLDGGALALLIAGAAYGIKSLRKKKGKDE